jgi:hypothetical protein
LSDVFFDTQTLIKKGFNVAAYPVCGMRQNGQAHIPAEQEAFADILAGL